MRGSGFIFNCFNFLHYKSRNINLKCGGSYVDPPDWIKNKKVTTNPINYDDEFFQCAATVTLNHAETGKNSQGISKIKPSINKNDWKGINYLSEKGN